MSSFLLALIIFLINGASVLKFYQIKDYLFKRAQAHFYLPSSKKIVFNKKEYFLYFFFLIIFVLIISDYWYLVALYQPLILKIDFLIFLATFLFILRYQFLKKIHFTPKAIIISLLTFLINFFFLKIFANHLLFFSLFNLWVVQFIFFTISISIFDFGVKPYLIFLGKKVQSKLEKHKNKGLKIVGLAGSYGKSSTKEILNQILNKKYKVLSLPPRINHEYAILKFLLKAKLENYEYLLIEFGSYYLGNIKFITKFVTPDIAFITGITQQHLFLFGNIKNIIKGEGIEILENMKPKSKVFVNNNHEYFKDLLEEIKKLNKNFKIITYGKNADYSYQIIENNLEKCKFKINENVWETNLVFPQQIENLTGALAFIFEENLSLEKEIIENIELPEGFLKIKQINNLYIFDDSYNANPRGVFEGLKFFKGLNFDYKIIIFNGLFELGKETEKIYEKLSQEFLNFDKIILTSKDYLEIFERNLKDKILVFENKKELELFLKNLPFKKVALWIFNRLPEKLKIFNEKAY